MRPPSRALARSTAIMGSALLLTLTAGAARAGTAVPFRHGVSAAPAGNGPVYAAHTQVLSGNGTSSSAVTCPSGTLPVGGGTAVQNPRIEHVAQAGFVASATTEAVDGYAASVQVSGLPRGGHVRFAVQAACVPSASMAVIYPVHTLVLPAHGTTVWGVPCPSGTLPTGGGTAVQDPRAEHVAQAGFVASTATGKVDGYAASVQVSGLPRGGHVRFAVQAACVPTTVATIFYLLHTVAVAAPGTVSSGVACPAGTVPVGGGVAVQDPRAGRAAQAGFAVSAATGKPAGYEASVQVSGLARGASVRIGVQAACLKAPPAPAYGPPTVARSAGVISSAAGISS